MKSIGKTIKCIELSGIIKFLVTRIYQSAAKVLLEYKVQRLSLMC